MRSLYPGVAVALFYPDDPDFWHEAIIIYGSADKCFHILTPDGDEYAEDVACVDGEGPSRAVVIGPAGECPVDLTGKFYRFSVFPGEKAFRDKVREMSRVESPAFPFPAKVRTMTKGDVSWPDFVGPPVRPAAAAGPPPAAVLDAAAATPPRRRIMTKRAAVEYGISTPHAIMPEADEDDGLQRAIAASRAVVPEPATPPRKAATLIVIPPEGGAGKWRALIAERGFKKGDVVDMLDGSFNLGGYGVALLSSGQSLPVEWVLATAASADEQATGIKAAPEELLAGAGVDTEDDRDERLLPLKYDLRGWRYTEFKIGADMLMDPDREDLIQVIDGPPTLTWCAHFMAQHGGTPLAYHSRWQHEAQLSIDDAGVLDHETLCHILQVAVIVDQINIGRCLSFELVARALQRIQGKYRERLTIGGGKGGGKKSRGALEEDYHMIMGTQATWGRVLIRPALSEYLADCRQKKAALLKEERKLDEERRLAAKAGGEK